MLRIEDSPNMRLIRRELKQRDLSAYDVAELLGINIRNARPYMKYLHEQHEVRICRWRTRHHGPWIAVYELGDEPDAPYPTGHTRDRRRMKRIMSAPSLLVSLLKGTT